VTRTDLIKTDRKTEPGDEITITGRAFESLLSWAPRPGAAVTVTGPGGESFRARVIKLGENKATLFVYEKMAGPAESSLEIILLQALPDKERMELVIEKATELGVSMIVPWKAEKGVDLIEREKKQPKAHRWPERAKKAARQCRRAKIPAIVPFCELEDALEFASGADLKILLWENADQPLKQIVSKYESAASAALMIGPEGGLTKKEVEAAKRAGFAPASFGARVLRTETAAIVAVSIIQYAFGDLG
jgi:16S rRNA (uracil1498-N3)-methyltransferase